MVDFWITTHWPTPHGEPRMSRHVFIRRDAPRRSLPKLGDFVFFRESLHAVIDGTKVMTVARHHRGGVTPELPLSTGTGGIIGTATVDGQLRYQVAEDVLFNYGDLKKWQVIPCRDFQPATLSLEALKQILEVKGVIFLRLWRIPNRDLGQRILHALQSPTKRDIR